jgi:hypothetical protein
MNTNIPAAPEPSVPNSSQLSIPNLRVKDIWHQFWTDVSGKEVQTTATYSYTWVADQFGHLAVGMMVNFFATLVAHGLFYRFKPLVHMSEVLPVSLAGLGFSMLLLGSWERWSYQKSKRAAGAFRPDEKLLAANAWVATWYMWLGAGLYCVFHVTFHITPLGAFLVVPLVLLAIWLAPGWLRQKITWQKAGLPYLFRVADAFHLAEAKQSPLEKNDREEVDALINKGWKDGEAAQIVIGGPINSGRTELATGIGTEFAFKNLKVRYLSFEKLLEFVAHSSPGRVPFQDDFGPKIVTYWPWYQAHVVIIDDVGPLIAADNLENSAKAERLKDILHKRLGSVCVVKVLSRCHTIWVIGDLRSDDVALPDFGDRLEQFAQVIGEYCGSRRALVVELGKTPQGFEPGSKKRIDWVSADRPTSEYGTLDDARTMLDKAVAALKADKKKALENFNKEDGGFRDRDLYVFCANASDSIQTAHPSDIGKKLSDDRDKNKFDFGKKIMSTATEGKIDAVAYVRPRPGSDTLAQKITYVTKVGDQVCGVGYYKNLP